MSNGHGSNTTGRSSSSEEEDDDDRKRRNLQFVLQMTTLIDRDNPNHRRAAEHLIYEVGMDPASAATKLSMILQRHNLSSLNPIMGRLAVSQETHNKLLNWLGKKKTRPVVVDQEQQQQRENDNYSRKYYVMKAIEICQKIHLIIPSLEINDPKRLDILEKKYYAVVATNSSTTLAEAEASNAALCMSEYLFFLDQLLYAHPNVRNLGSAIYHAWIYIWRAHVNKPDDDVGIFRGSWCCRVEEFYVNGDGTCPDKVSLPKEYVDEAVDMCYCVGIDFGFKYTWDKMFDPDLTDLLRRRLSAQVNVMEAKKICQKIQSIIPSLEINDPKRLDILEKKYYAVVAQPLPTAANNLEPNHIYRNALVAAVEGEAKDAALRMPEYLFFLDQMNYAHANGRDLGSAIFKAWELIWIIHASKADSVETFREQWHYKLEEWYIHGDGCYHGDGGDGADPSQPRQLPPDKVFLPEEYMDEAADMSSWAKGNEYFWDNQGDPYLTDLLKKVSNRCANCHCANEENLLKCGACKMIYYCSKKCQKDHWKKADGGHKRMCKTWR